MTAREFTQWAAFHSISPIDDERAHDLGPALVRATLAAVHGGKVNPVELLPFRIRLSDDFDGAEKTLMKWAEMQGAKGA